MPRLTRKQMMIATLRATLDRVEKMREAEFEVPDSAKHGAPLVITVGAEHGDPIAACIVCVEDPALNTDYVNAIDQVREGGGNTVNDFTPFDVHVCRLCGCTDDNACEGGCWWAEEDLCSTCAARKVHRVKCWPDPFAATACGAKPYEVRNDDRGYGVGDVLELCEWDPNGGYTGRELTALITAKTPGGAWGLPDGVCVLGLGFLRRVGDVS